MLAKKFEPPAGIEPTTFQIQARRTNHLAMGNSHGEQVAGQDFASHVYAGLKQSNTPTCLHHTSTLKKCCVHFKANHPPMPLA